MTKEELIKLVKFTAGEIVEPTELSIEDAESIVDDFVDAEQLTIPFIVQAKPEKVCELIRQKFDDWVFGLETQAGEKLKVVDSNDFNDIITEIESKLKENN